MIATIGRYPGVLIGSATLGGRHCCDAELYVLKDEIRKGLTSYDKYFKHEGLNEVVAVGEKTPEYAGHPMVPYRVKALFGSNVKLLYTYRDSIEMDMSNFLMNISGGGGKEIYPLIIVIWIG